MRMKEQTQSGKRSECKNDSERTQKRKESNIYEA